MDIKGKRVLFLSAYFFGYNNEISSAMERMGATVDYFDERPANTFFVKAMIRLRPKLLNTRINKYHNNIIKSTKKNKYDYIFIIKAESITVDSLNKLKETHPQAKMILYLWDSFNNFKSGNRKLPVFDRALSFDKRDCDRYGMIFRPLFYTMDYAKVLNSDIHRDIDALFIGTMHSDRYSFIKHIEATALNYGYNVYHYFFFMSKILYYKMKWFDKVLDGTKMSDFMFKSITQPEIIELFKRTNCVIDIQHPNQTGLTMRTIEVFGSGRKLITTNSDVVNYDFYDPNNILVVDRMNPMLSKEFFNKEYKNTSSEIYNKYSINSWINDVLG